MMSQMPQAPGTLVFARRGEVEPDRVHQRYLLTQKGREQGEALAVLIRGLNWYGPGVVVSVDNSASRTYAQILTGETGYGRKTYGQGQELEGPYKDLWPMISPFARAILVFEELRALDEMVGEVRPDLKGPLAKIKSIVSAGDGVVLRSGQAELERLENSVK